MTYDPKSGHVGPGVFWQRGDLLIYRHCDGVFELLHCGVRVMPIAPFAAINRYLWLEFDVL